MWARGAAIRPVPSFARIREEALRAIEEDFTDDERGHQAIQAAFARFSDVQPQLSAGVQRVLDRPLDDMASALGHFLAVAVWLAFDREFGARLLEVTLDGWRATEDALALEEELRSGGGARDVDLDDVLAMAQPQVSSFIHDHLEAALGIAVIPDDDACGPCEPPSETAHRDVGDLRLVLRTILLETLALSHAVRPRPEDASPELFA